MLWNDFVWNISDNSQEIIWWGVNLREGTMNECSHCFLFERFFKKVKKFSILFSYFNNRNISKTIYHIVKRYWLSKLLPEKRKFRLVKCTHSLQFSLNKDNKRKSLREVAFLLKQNSWKWNRKPQRQSQCFFILEWTNKQPSQHLLVKSQR